jgi:hypothetical protein
MVDKRDVSRKFRDVLLWIEGEKREPRGIEDRTLRTALDKALGGDLPGALRCLESLQSEDAMRTAHHHEVRTPEALNVMEWRGLLKRHSL